MSFFCVAAGGGQASLRTAAGPAVGRRLIPVCLIAACLGGCSDRPDPPPRAVPSAVPVHRFRGRFELGTPPRVYVTYTGVGSLSDVNATVTFRPRSGTPVERDSRFARWQSGEAKEFLLDGLPPQSHEDGFDWSLSGTARVHSEPLSHLPDGARGILEARWEGSALAFEIKKDEGGFSHDVLVTYRGGTEASSADVTLIVRYQDGTETAAKRYWAVLRPGETQKVNVPAKAPIEQVELRGTMSVGGKAEEVGEVATWR